MVGTTAQMVSLVSYGNDYLETGIQDKKLTYNSTFEFCRFVTFKVNTVQKNTFGNNQLIIGKPYEWFDYLKEDGCIKLRLLYRTTEKKNSLHDYMTAGFIGGGGEWFVETVYDNKSVLWASRWIVNKFGAQDNRIWEVTYMNVDTLDTLLPMHEDVNIAKKDLNDSLKEIEKFAARTDRKMWAERFRAAIKELDAAELNNGYIMDFLVEKNYTLTAMQLLSGAEKAWVFGGMGWWNDFYYENVNDQELNTLLSQKLYYNICKSIVVATNSYQPN